MLTDYEAYFFHKHTPGKICNDERSACQICAAALP